MKNYILGIVFLFALLFTNCSKENTKEKELVAGRCRISCTLSGAVNGNYLSDDIYSFSAYNSVYMVLDAVSINNSTNVRQDISLLIPVSTTPGTYHLDEASAPNISFSYLKKDIYLGGDKTWTAGIGSDFTFVISKASYTEVEGTFSGTAHNISDGTDIVFTNGKFKTQFTH